MNITGRFNEKYFNDETHGFSSFLDSYKGAFNSLSSTNWGYNFNHTSIQNATSAIVNFDASKSWTGEKRQFINCLSQYL